MSPRDGAFGAGNMDEIDLHGLDIDLDELDMDSANGVEAFDMDELDLEDLGLDEIDELDMVPGLGDEVSDLSETGLKAGPEARVKSRVSGYALIGQGNANKVFRNLETNELIRVSKTNADVEKIVSYWNSWKPRLGEYMKDIKVFHDPLYGACLQIDEVQSTCQFKPKWLAQSPTAPSNSLSCRTCAVKQMRDQPNSWCALDLGFNDVNGISKLVNSMNMNPKHMGVVIDSLVKSKIFVNLKRLQQEAHLEDAMTLRDVTIMIEKNTYKPYIVDLDPKRFKPKWTELEQQLIPYYLARSAVCRLSRTKLPKLPKLPKPINPL